MQEAQNLHGKLTLKFQTNFQNSIKLVNRFLSMIIQFDIKLVIFKYYLPYLQKTLVQMLRKLEVVIIETNKCHISRKKKDSGMAYLRTKQIQFWPRTLYIGREKTDFQ